MVLINPSVILVNMDFSNSLSHSIKQSPEQIFDQGPVS